MDETLIDRGEIVGLLWNVGDTPASLKRIEELLHEEDDGEEEADT